MKLEPINQTKLYGLENYFNELINLYRNQKFPNKILLSGPKGVGKMTLAYHLVNFILSRDENYSYDEKNLEINTENRSFKLVLNKTNPNLFLLDVGNEKKNIDIQQTRNLISNLNKSSFNKKPRFVLIDNIEFLGYNTMNSLLKIIEEPNQNTYFILIDNNKKNFETLFSRCLTFKIFLSNKQTIKILEKLINDRFDNRINPDLIDYYISPGNIYNLIKFSEINKIDLVDTNLKDFLYILSKNNFFKNDYSINHILYNLMEFYLVKTKNKFKNFSYNYNYFLKKISDTKKYNLDHDSLLIEFQSKILNG